MNIKTLLIANRGEIARRVMRTAKAMGIATVAVYSDADAGAAHVGQADEAVRIGPAPARESYLSVPAILAAAKAAGAHAIHPGYGFLSENADFAQACADAGLIFVGPPPAAIRAMGLKDRAKALMEAAGVAVVPGYMGDDQSPAHLAAQAERIGYPVLIKAVAGGGGKGMRRVERAEEFAAALASAQREAQAAFGEARVLIEKYITRPRHIEIQVFADLHGNCIHLFERDCSLQRRHQKVVEEALAPGMPEAMRAAMGAAAVKAAKAVGYAGAGTVEFIADASEGLKADRFWFMEMNTRLQVEHPVTEQVTGLDLVEWQLRVARGEILPKLQDEIVHCGHAIEVRLYAEDADKGFLPSIGTLEALRFPSGSDGIRIETGVRQGDAVTPYYDPMIAKLIASAPTRAEAAQRLAAALAHTEIAGVTTNAAFLIRCLTHPAFIAGEVDTGFIERHAEVLLPPPAPPPASAYAAAAEFLAGDRIVNTAAGGWRDPWGAQDGFRLNGVATETIEFAGEGKRIAVTRSHGRDGRISLAVDGEAAPGVPHCAVIRLASGEIAVMAGGTTHKLMLHDPFAVRGAAAGAADRITAPMPGKVIQLFVRAGETVSRGTPLMVLEAMKMEHTLSAPADVTIEAIEAAVGDQVRDGARLMTFASEPQ